MPDTPTQAPARVDSGTDTTKITISMPEIIDNSDEAGGTLITSYNLEWNQGLGTTFTEVVGETSANLNKEITIEDNINSGDTYLFRYRVKNIFGFSSGYSP